MMMPTVEMRAHVERLQRDRTPFVLATVVRAERPTSAKPGDTAVVLADGSIDGFVGGACAESTVRLEGLRLLAEGESELLRVTPDASDATSQEGVKTVGNPCLSGGTLEIFLEAVRPPLLVHVYGESPVGRALQRVGKALDLDVRAVADSHTPLPPDTAAVVVASHGRDEEPVLRAALDAGVPYVALVASRRRAAAVLSGLGNGADAVRAPAGLDIGARSPAEIALSVYAEIVSLRPRAAAAAPATPAAPAEVVDPVCGMTVVAGSLAVEHDGAVVSFCGPGCREAFRADPAKYAASA